MRAGGIAPIQGVFEYAAVRTLPMRKTAVNSPILRPTANFAVSDVIKISVNPTSENHHQFVVKATILEKDMRKRKSIPKKINKELLRIFIWLTHNI
jgi:hypothetical protein